MLIGFDDTKSNENEVCDNFFDRLINLPFHVVNFLILKAPGHFFFQRNSEEQTFLDLLAAKKDKKYILLFQNLMRDGGPNVQIIKFLGKFFY